MQWRVPVSGQCKPAAAPTLEKKGGFWFATYQGALNAELFIEFSRR